MSKKAKHYFIKATNHAFRFAILLRGLWAGKPKLKTMSVRKGLKLCIIKLSAQITLE